MALTAGMDQRLSLFQVDGKSNPSIQTLSLQTFPIHQASFSASGTQVVLTSRLRSFKYFDMLSGSVVDVPKIKGMRTKIFRFLKYLVLF